MARAKRGTFKKPEVMTYRTGAVSIQVEDTLTGLLEGLKEVYDDGGERGIALAGARVISEEARSNAERQMYKGPPKARYSSPGKISGWVRPGELRDAIFHAYKDSASSTDGKQTYAVSWNTKKVGFGHLIEHGHRVRNRKDAPFSKRMAGEYKIVTRSISKAQEAFAAMRKRAYEKLDYYLNKGGA